MYVVDSHVFDHVRTATKQSIFSILNDRGILSSGHIEDEVK